MNRISTLLILFLYSSFLFAQVQITNIEFNDQRIDQPSKGFVSYAGQEYFIEKGRDTTFISLVKEDGLELKHTIQYPIQYQNRSGEVLNYALNNSGLIHDGNKLYSVYNKHIFINDIETGETLEIIDLNELNISIRSEFFIQDGFFFFKGHLNPPGGQTYFKFDPTQGTFQNTDFSTKAPTYRIGTKLYQFREDANQFLSFDLMTEIIDSVQFDPATSYSLQVVNKNGYPSSFLLYTVNRDEVISIDSYLTHQNLNCLENIPFLNTICLDNYLVFTVEAGNQFQPDRLYIMDKMNCNELKWFNLPDHVIASSIEFIDSDLFQGEYLIATMPNDWEGFGEHFLIDLEERSLTNLDMITDNINIERSIRYGNNLYVVTSDHIHHIGGIPEFYEIDLQSKTATSVDEYDKISKVRIILGEKHPDQTFNVYYQTGRIEEYPFPTNYPYLNAVHRFEHTPHTLEPIHAINDTKNYGASYVRNGFWYQDKYFFWCRDAIYVIVDDKETKLTDAKATSYFNVPKFVVKENILRTLLHQDSSFYSLNLNLDNLDIQLTRQGDGSPHSFINSSNVIYYELANNKFGYYDFRTNSTKEFVIGDHMHGELYAQSISGSSSILVDFIGFNERVYYFYNSDTEEGFVFPIDLREFQFIPDQQGNFYLTSRDHDNLQFLSKDGELSMLREEFNYSKRGNQDVHFENGFSTLFKSDTELLILSEIDGDIKLIPIPLDEYSSSLDLIWLTTDSLHYIQTRNQDNYNDPSFYELYSYNHDQAPLKLFEQARNTAIANLKLIGNTLSLISVDLNEDQVIFETYNLLNKTFEIKQIFDHDYSLNYHMNSKVGTLSDSELIINLDDGVIGNEPYVYNFLNGDLQLLKDMMPVYFSSNPGDFTVAPDRTRAYFTATLENLERQFFMLENENRNFGQDPTQEKLEIHPSLASGFITLNEDVEEFFVFDQLGQLAMQIRDYKMNERIDISQLSGGTYFLAIYRENEYVKAGKFIKIE